MGRRTQASVVGLALAATLVLAVSLGLQRRWAADGPPTVSGTIVHDSVAAVALASEAPDVPSQSDAIEFFERRLRERGGVDPLARRHLVAAHLLRFRGYGRDADLSAAQAHISTLRSRTGRNATLATAMASVRMSRHEFRDAVVEATRAVASAGTASTSQDRFRLFDVLLAVGRYDEAAGLLELPHDRTSFGFLVRAARLADRQGDLDGARSLMERALAWAISRAQPAPVVAWCLTELAHLEHHAGNATGSVQLYLRALETLPGSPTAVEGIAWVAYGVDRNLHLARDLFEHALRLGGHLDLYVVLAEIDVGLGDEARAGARLERLESELNGDRAAQRLFRIPLALMLADDPETVGRAVDLAKAEVRERRSTEALDVLAWAHFRAGDEAEALALSREARAWGTPEPRILYRSGVIELEAGDPGVGRRLLEEVRGAADEVGPIVADEARQRLASAEDALS